MAHKHSFSCGIIGELMTKNEVAHQIDPSTSLNQTHYVKQISMPIECTASRFLSAFPIFSRRRIPHHSRLDGLFEMATIRPPPWSICTDSPISVRGSRL